MAFTSNKLEVNGLNFHVVDEGKPGDPVVLLLHGFPDSSELWRYQIPVLRDAGYRVIAPDLRGFGQSDKPAKPADYELPLLAGDVLGILTKLDIGEFHLVGHDWGAVLAWILAAYMSQPPSSDALAAMPPAIAKIVLTAKVKPQIKSLAALSVGHPQAYKDPPLLQREKSWYILFFQFPRAEAALAHKEYQLLRQWSGDQKEADRWIAHFESAKPANLLAMLNWYRLNANPERSIADSKDIPVIKVPTLGIWSSDDPHQTEMPMKTSGQFVESNKWSYERIEGAGHWMQLDKPNYINKRLLDWLQECAAK
jgi:pimeloyl-ACP methyl ester carboxylesterase